MDKICMNNNWNFFGVGLRLTLIRIRWNSRTGISQDDWNIADYTLEVLFYTRRCPYKSCCLLSIHSLLCIYKWDQKGSSNKAESKGRCQVCKLLNMHLLHRNHQNNLDDRCRQENDRCTDPICIYNVIRGIYEIAWFQWLESGHSGLVSDNCPISDNSVL